MHGIFWGLFLCHAFTTQSLTFRYIPKKNLLIEIHLHIWFQQRFLISGKNSTTLFSVIHIVRFFGPRSSDGSCFFLQWVESMDVSPARKTITNWWDNGWGKWRQKWGEMRPMTIRNNQHITEQLTIGWEFSRNYLIFRRIKRKSKFFKVFRASGRRRVSVEELFVNLLAQVD